MNVLLACEVSQTVCIEFRKRGHNAFSNDLLPAGGGRPEWHLQMDAIAAIESRKWDLMIAFPPCTHLALSGAKHFEKKRADGRQGMAIAFFISIASAAIPRIAIENPMGVMSTIYRKPDQVIHPYHFGDPATKTTCLWLKGLPKLRADCYDAPLFGETVDRGEFHVTKGGNKLPKWYNLPPSEDRGHIRSKTFPGIGRAMAEQWGDLQNA